MMHRTLTTRHPAAPGVEFRVSLHQPVKMEPAEGDTPAALAPQGEPWIVIETFIRQDNGDWKMVASLRQGAFDETVADINALSTFLMRQRSDATQAEPEPEQPRRRGRRVITADDVD